MLRDERAVRLGAVANRLRRHAHHGRRLARGRSEDPQLGNHLALLVMLDQSYLVDVGFGSVLTKPLPLAARTHNCTPYEVSLAVAGAGYWRYSERAYAEPFTFDFKPEPADENLLADEMPLAGDPCEFELRAQYRRAAPAGRAGISRCGGRSSPRLVPQVSLAESYFHTKNGCKSCAPNSGWTSPESKCSGRR